MRTVIIETPFAGKSRLPAALPAFLHRAARALDRRRNVRFARACLHDALQRGDAPLASHLLYTQPGVLDDDDPEERQLGIDAGLTWHRKTDAAVVYTDRGISGGMRYGIKVAREAGVPVEHRTLYGESDPADASSAYEAA